MGETLKIGDSIRSLDSAKVRQPDGSYDFVADPDGGVLSVPQFMTVVEIISRPENEEKATLVANNLWGKITSNQGVLDGKLKHEDDKKLGHLFDPTVFYIVEM